MNPGTDLDPVERRLRDGLRDPFWPGRTPDADVLLRQVARARRRRPILVAACLAVLLAVAGTTLAVARGAERAAPSPAATPSPTVPPVLADLTAIWPPQAWFADAQHGYLALYNCDGVPPVPTPGPVGPPPGTCPVYLAATADGGRTWQARAVPGATVPELADRVNRLVYGLDADHLVMERFTGDSPLFTADGGRTWRALADPVDVVDEVPPGAVLTVRRGNGAGVFTVIRPDGTTARLNHPPALTGVEAFTGGLAAFAADGALWVKAAGLNIVQFAFVSRDRGRTWTLVRGPADAVVVYGTTGSTVFAVDYARTRIWRSTDEGQHWTQVALPFTTTNPPELWIEARDDGSLLAGDAVHGKVYQVAPGSSSAVGIPVDVHMFAWHLGTGCLKAVLAGAPFALDTEKTRSYDVAPDCVQWRQLPFAVH